MDSRVIFNPLMVCSILRDSKENAWLEINKNFVSLLMIKLYSFNIMALSLKWNMGHFIILSLATCKGTCTLEGIAVCYVLTGFIKFLFYYFLQLTFFVFLIILAFWFILHSCAVWLELIYITEFRMFIFSSIEYQLNYNNWT